jgi:uncharacterized protein (DUF924 family)
MTRSKDNFDRRKYEPLVSKLVTLPLNELLDLGKSPDESLTLILLLDQVSRNYSRGKPFPYTVCDPISQQLAEHFVLAKQHDKQLPPFKRMWYYLPFSHAESIYFQELAIAKLAEACWDHRDGEWKTYHGLLKMHLEYAWKHFVVINKFGRYPGRNKIMGRETTPEEQKYMDEGGDTFQKEN